MNRKSYFYICEDCKEAIPQRLDIIKAFKNPICRICSNRRKGKENRNKIRKATLEQMKRGNWHNVSKLTGEKLIKSKEKRCKTLHNEYESGELIIWNKGKRGKGMPRYIEDRSKLKEPINEQIRGSIDMKNWKKSVIKRDKYICQICHEKSGDLNIHHIKSFSKYSDLRFDINNGITLCKECHDYVHKLNTVNY